MREPVEAGDGRVEAEGGAQQGAELREELRGYPGVDAQPPAEDLAMADVSEAAAPRVPRLAAGTLLDTVVAPDRP